MYQILTKYQKTGATFASGVEAHNNKNSLFSPDLNAAIEACYSTMLNNGVLLEPVSYDWDQETQTLTVLKVVSSLEEYSAAVTFNNSLVVQGAANAGWVFIPQK